ncbi:MAG: methyltransferase domain-containing protein [Chitinivibrionales bacterium]
MEFPFENNPNKKRILSSFSGKAATYNQNAEIQKMAGLRLCSLLKKECFNEAGVLLDAGCGTGLFLSLSKDLLRTKHTLLLDISRPSLEIAGNTICADLINGDMEAMPFKRGVFDTLSLLSSFQWAQSPKEFLKELNRVITPGGKFIFTVFLKGSLTGLKGLQDKYSIHPPVFFPERKRFISMLESAGFRLTSSETATERVHFDTGYTALRSISGIGASTAGEKRLTLSEIKEFAQEYGRSNTDSTGVFTEYEYICGTAEKTQAVKEAV